MAYRIDFTQKKNGTFLVAASAGDGVDRDEHPERVQAIPLQSAEAFIILLQTAELSVETVSALTAAASKAASQPDSPVICGRIDFTSCQLMHLGLGGVDAGKGSAAA